MIRHAARVVTYIVSHSEIDCEYSSSGNFFFVCMYMHSLVVGQSAGHTEETNPAGPTQAVIANTWALEDKSARALVRLAV